MRTYLSVLLICFPLSTFATTEASITPSPDKPSIEKKYKVPPYNATYTLLHKSDPVGEATRKLTYLDNGNAVYHYETDIEWLIFSDKRSETSTLSIQQDQVTPLHYLYDREGTGRDKHYEWQYQFSNKSAKDLVKNKTITIDRHEGLQDKLSYHLQNRIDLINNPEQQRFVYPVISTSGSIKDYVYTYDGEEELMLPYGLVKTIRLKREIPEKKRITYAWFAPKLDYLLVKLYQVKAGAEQFEAQLSKIEQ
ncbi:DUF3108 domain-containing protein [Colwellia asteriadis]|uniref:DUF3108 domain-containing protein n=1 Tax=Colwellia asteriadis TaxID=517723 RepID=A0ABP3WLF6_9GAMM